MYTGNQNDVFPQPKQQSNWNNLIPVENKKLKRNEVQTIKMMNHALRTYGPAPGAQKLLNQEKKSALESMESQFYSIYRCVKKGKETDFCTRLNKLSKCFCGHAMGEHQGRLHQKCQTCSCKRFRYIPQRPEEIGEGYLLRRRNFDLSSWFAKCRCKHSSKDHDPNAKYCKKCSCGCFDSHFLCLVCDEHWEDHDTQHESEDERKMLGKPIGEEYMPFQEIAELQEIVFKRNPVRKKRNNNLNPKRTQAIGVKPTTVKKPSKISCKKAPKKPELSQ